MFPVDAYLLDKDPPAIVYVSKEETQDVEWGYVQFPFLGSLADGNMILGFQMGDDSEESYGKDKYKYFVSSLNGKEWMPVKNNERPYAGIAVDEQTIISLETLEPVKIEDITLPAEPTTWIPYDYSYSEPQKAYSYDLLPPFARTLGIRRTTSDGKSVVEKAPVTLYKDLRVRYDELLPIIFFGPLLKLQNGEIAGVFYPSFAATEDDLIDTKCGVVLVHSNDKGNTWKQMDRLPYLPDLKYDPKGDLRGGFTETAAELLSDGSLFLAMRTADATPEPYPGCLECGPLYTVKRSPSGEWTQPVPVSPFGVMPQLLKLKNGLLILSYGRPGVQLRVSDDEGKTWTAPYDIVESKSKNQRAETCGYTSLAPDPTNPNAFFIAYSNFQFVGEDKKDHKAICVQHCTLRGPLILPLPPADPVNESNHTIQQYYAKNQEKIAVRIPLKNDLLTGLSEGFYENGSPSFITPYADGKIHGVQRFYAPEGYLMKSMPYYENKVHGVVNFFDQRGNILREDYYLYDRKTTQKEFIDYFKL